MCDNWNSGVIQVQPGGNLSVGYDEDVSHPGGVFLHRAQRIAELLVVLKSACWNIFILFRLEGKRKIYIFIKSIFIKSPYITDQFCLYNLHYTMQWNNINQMAIIKGYKRSLYLWNCSEVPEQVCRTDG